MWAVKTAENIRASSARFPRRLRRRILAGAVLLTSAVGSVSCTEPAGGRVTGGTGEGWHLTVYYTAVEGFHADTPLTTVRGCPQRDCAFGDELLGAFPAGFVDAVRDEGAGRITSGPRSGSMLNWSFDTGFWLDDIPSDTAGRALVPFRSAAADPSTLPAGTAFVIDHCGHEEDGSAIDPAACEALRRTTWEVRDEFTPGLGGERRLDLYIGEEDGPGFTETSPLYLTCVDARVTVTGRADADRQPRA